MTTAILDNRKRWVEEVRNCYAGIFKLEEPAKVRVLAVELKLDNMVVRGVPLIGFIDRVREVIAGSGDRAPRSPKHHLCGSHRTYGPASCRPLRDLYAWGKA